MGGGWKLPQRVHLRIVGEWGVQLGHHLHMLQGHPDDRGSCQVIIFRGWVNQENEPEEELFLVTIYSR